MSFSVTLNPSTSTAVSASFQSSCAPIDLVEPLANVADGARHDLEQAVLLRLEVVIERGCTDVDRRRDVGPFRVLVPEATEVLGRDVEDLFLLGTGLLPRRVPRVVPCRLACPCPRRLVSRATSLNLSRVRRDYSTERTHGLVSSDRPSRLERGFRETRESGDGRLQRSGVRAVRRIVQPAAIHPLDDDRHLPVREGDPEAEVVE